MNVLRSSDWPRLDVRRGLLPRVPLLTVWTPCPSSHSRPWPGTRRWHIRYHHSRASLDPPAREALEGGGGGHSSCSHALGLLPPWQRIPSTTDGDSGTPSPGSAWIRCSAPSVAQPRDDSAASGETLGSTTRNIPGHAVPPRNIAVTTQFVRSKPRLSETATPGSREYATGCLGCRRSALSRDRTETRRRDSVGARRNQGTREWKSGGVRG